MQMAVRVLLASSYIMVMNRTVHARFLDRWALGPEADTVLARVLHHRVFVEGATRASSAGAPIQLNVAVRDPR